MTYDAPLDSPDIGTLRRIIRRRRFKRRAVIGDENGLKYAGRGKIWVRFRGGMNTDGNTTFEPAVKVNRGGATFFEHVGAPVWVHYDDGDELAIKGVDNQEADAAELDTGILNYGSRSSRWIRLKNVVRLVARPVGTAANPSTLVSVRSLIYDNDYGDLYRLEATGRQADKIDLASYIPTAGNHAVVCIFLRTVANTFQVVSSTAQSIATDIDLTDYQECFAQRDAETVPIQGFILGDAQTSITISDLGEDLRQFVNMPRSLGFPNPVDMQQIIRSGRTEYVGGTLTITDTLTVEGTLTNDSSGDPVQVWRDHEPSTMTVNTGTLVSGTVADVQKMFDGNEIEVDEVVGAPGFDVQFDFTDVSQTEPPNFVVCRWKYDGSATHFCTVDIYNYTTTSWDQLRYFTNTDTYYASMTMYIPNANRGDYVDSSGNAQIRFYHHTAGNASHDFHVEYVGLTHGVHL